MTIPQKPPPDDRCCCACALCIMNWVVSKKRFAQSDRQASSLELRLRPGVPIHFSQHVLVSSEIVRCSCAFACSCCKNCCSCGDTPPFSLIVCARTLSEQGLPHFVLPGVGIVDSSMQHLHSGNPSDTLGGNLNFNLVLHCLPSLIMHL